ncbi:MAG: sigma-70 family RNA polymerase sigma factor [Verrucomicrobiales bacterium]
MEDHELLREYIDNRSEAAFGELVNRHINLVHSAALRQVHGDAHAAEDITQSVFLDLARKAKSLARHTSLAGWLYTSARYLAANTRRSETRRRSREQEAQVMNELFNYPSSETPWAELRPLIDEAMHELSTPDREAILLRYFEKLSYADVGRRLRLSENAARMRAERALEKLRSILEKHGLATTTMGLSSILALHAVSAAPGFLANRIANAVISTSPATFFGLNPIGQFLATPRFKVALGLLGLCLLSFLLVETLSRKDLTVTHNDLVRTKGSNAAENLSDSATLPGSPIAPLNSEEQELKSVASTSVLAPGPHHKLWTLSAETGEPVPNVPVESRRWTSSGFKGEKLQSDAAGLCLIPSLADTKQLELTTRMDGYADTRLYWRPDRGEKIPAEHTVKLAKPAWIGGRVVDADGYPVAGAKVGFNHKEDLATINLNESHNFSWIEVLTDSNGRWEINRIAPEMISHLYGSAKHPDHVPTSLFYVSKEPESLKQLTEGTHLFTLGHALTISGVVLDSEEKPLAGATVRYGRVGDSDARTTTSNTDGSFIIPGCKPGPDLLSAEAHGFAPLTQRVDLSPATGPFAIMLSRGKPLRIRVVNHRGDPIPHVNAFLDTFGDPTFTVPASTTASEPVPIQASPKLKSDSSGRIRWENAPDQELDFDFAVKGYMRKNDVLLRPSEKEHPITLDNSLRIHGSVVDAETGKPLPQFRIITGWPQQMANAKKEAMWSSLERFWLKFVGGTFDHTYEEPVVSGVPNPGYVLKFEADGYAPFVSEFIDPSETDYTLNVRLKRATTEVVQVMNPDGTPAREADVALLVPNARVEVIPGGLVSNQSAGALIRADASGKFKLPPDDSLKFVAAANQEGFVVVPASQVKKSLQVKMVPWGTVSGTLLEGGKPAANKEIGISTGEFVQGGLMASALTFKTKTSDHGKFTFAKTPPGSGTIVLVVPYVDELRGFSAHQVRPFSVIHVQPGFNPTVTLDLTNKIALNQFTGALPTK